MLDGIMLNVLLQRHLLGETVCNFILTQTMVCSVFLLSVAVSGIKNQSFCIILIFVC
jgi:hypothetical protein